MSRRLYKEQEGGFAPFFVVGREDRKDDPINAGHVCKSDHLSSAATGKIMKKRGTIASLTVCLVLGVTAYALYRFWGTVLRTPQLPPPAPTTLRAPASRQQTTAFEPPLPPPRPSGEIVPQARSEPSRALVGTANEQLKQIERNLPEDAQVATYPVSETEERAAFATADLIGDGRTETVVVYKAPGPPPDGGGQPLFLGVLAPDGDHLNLRSSARLYGGLIYISLRDKHAIPFAIRDVTGDERPEIIVTSGVGASLGGALQIYTFDGSSFHQIANADGHILELNNKGPGKPSEITARSRYEATPRVYRWNGHGFQP